MKKSAKGKFYSVVTIEKSLRHHVIEWVATCLSVFASLLNTNIIQMAMFDSYASSFYVYFFADLLWISFALKHKHWGVFTTFVLFGVVNLVKIFSLWGFINL